MLLLASAVLFERRPLTFLNKLLFRSKLLSRGSVSPADVLVYASILLLGALQFFYYVRSPDAAWDATYVDLARSILEKHSYQLNFQPETLYPPGFALILAAAALVAGFSQAVLFHVIAVAAVIGLLASYELLRRVEGRAFAAVACLLFASSPTLFAFDTEIVLSDTAYFAASMLALLLAFKVEHSTGVRQRWLTGLFATALIASLMIRSSGLAMLLAMASLMMASLLRRRASTWGRVRLLLVPLLLAGAAQAMWSGWASSRQSKEWELPGWPQSYLSQLKVKNGNDPELGEARLSDIPVRLEENLKARSMALVKLFTQKSYIAPNWLSPAVFGVTALIAAGLILSLLKGGGQLHDWYFLWHELMFLLWPWDFEIRFLLPVAPLALLYLARGVRGIVELSRLQPRRCGLLLLGMAVPLGAGALAWAAEAREIQPFLSMAFWGFLILVGFILIRARRPEQSPGLTVLPASSIRVKANRIARYSLSCATALLIASGVSGQVRDAHKNMAFKMTTGPYFGDIEAAEWIQENAPTPYVVMARKEDLVIHYSRHKVVWFPPISDPATLMKGIRELNVRLVVVVDRRGSYWQPPEQVCFDNLLKCYGRNFRLLHRGGLSWIYEVIAAPDGPAESCTELNQGGQDVPSLVPTKARRGVSSRLQPMP